MSANERKRVVVSVGGSLIVPDGIDTDFLTRFKTLILDRVAQGFTFSIVAGGGRTARRYQDTAEKITPLSKIELDWIGIQATRLNAQLLRSIFAGHVHEQIIKNPTVDVIANEPVTVAAGRRPGSSTDYAAVLIAKKIGATRLVNLTRTEYGDYIYDEDPLKNPNAKKIEKISWPEFRKLIPAEWDPGLSALFDPIAAKEAESLGLEVAIMNGANLEEFSKYLDGKPFAGTVIS